VDGLRLPVTASPLIPLRCPTEILPFFLLEKVVVQPALALITRKGSSVPGAIPDQPCADAAPGGSKRHRSQTWRITGGDVVRGR
jgi:hypothetical protein